MDPIVLTILLILLGIILILIFSSIVIVSAQSVKIIERLGKFSRILQPGLSFKIPILEWVAGSLSLRVQQMSIEAETKTKDNVFIKIRVDVQYYVDQGKAYSAFYKLTRPQEQIESYIFDVLRSSFPTMSLDESFEKKDEVAKTIDLELKQEISEYGYEILKVLVVDIDPAERVKQSMNEINEAQRQLEATKAKAEAQKLIVITEAEAEKEKMIKLGEGIAGQREAIANGLAKSYQEIDKASHGKLNEAKICDLLLEYQRYDTYEQMAKSSKTNTIFMPMDSASSGLTKNLISANLATQAAASE